MHDNKATLDKTKKDKWGLNVLAIDCELKENELKMRKDMMGDNRDNSTDSRVLSAVGYVPFENIVGRAQMIFFSIAEGEHAWMFWRWPTAVRWNRIFTFVR